MPLMGSGALKHLASSAVYPAPRTQYDETMSNLIWIPSELKTDSTKIPCLSFRIPHASHVIIYCHGNAADLGTIFYEAQAIANFANAHLIAVEYPGYGIYSGTPTEARIKHDVAQVFYYVSNILNYPTERIVLMGRSLGSGPASSLCQTLEEAGVNVGGLVLQSPFTSILDVARTFTKIAGLVIQEQWQNLAALRCVKKTPVLFIHGSKDTLVPHTMSEKLYQACPSPQKRLHLCENADHNHFHLLNDVIKPITLFLLESAEADRKRSAAKKCEGAEPPQKLKIPQSVYGSRSSFSVHAGNFKTAELVRRQSLFGDPASAQYVPSSPPADTETGATSGPGSPKRNLWTRPSSRDAAGVSKNRETFAVNSTSRLSRARSSSLPSLVDLAAGKKKKKREGSIEPPASRAKGPSIMVVNPKLVSPRKSKAFHEWRRQSALGAMPAGGKASNGVTTSSPEQKYSRTSSSGRVEL